MHVCVYATDCSLKATVKAPDRVFGIAMLDKKLYVLRQRPDNQIYVYSSDTMELTDDYITIPDYSLDESGWNDLQECEPEKCLFVSDFKGKCIRKVCLKGKTQVSKFVDVPQEPKGLSLTPEGNLLVCCNPNILLELDVKTGKTLAEVKLRSDIEYPKHAIKREDQQYLVCFDVQDGLHRVCIVGGDGYMRHAYGGMAGAGDLELHTPCYISLCPDDHVIVADNDNGRLVLLNSALEFVRYLIDIKEPHRIFFDKNAGSLYIGECANGDLKVFQVVYTLGGKK